MDEQVEAVRIMDEQMSTMQSWDKNEAEHLPLGKNTGDPLEDVKNIFPTMFDGSVGLFDGEVKLRVSPEQSQHSFHHVQFLLA